MTLDDAKQSWDDVTIFIEENLQKMAPFVPECSIYRVPKVLLDMNPNAYIPRIISIGPFHHKHNFEVTEELKLRFFNSYQCRIGLSVEDIVKKARVWEKTARQYYSEAIDMDSGEFVKMMVLDGCFIVEFMTECTKLFPKNQNNVHSSFYKAIEFNMSAELIMLENQLPFFVLQNLFDLIPSKSNDTSMNKIECFRDVVHSFLCDRLLPIKSRIRLGDNMSNRSPSHLLDFLSFYFVPEDGKRVEKNCVPPSATKLSEAGIVFKKVEEKEKTCIMDISFRDGILRMPRLVIDDGFETCARNLMAFSMFSCEEDVKNMKGNAIHYFLFLDELITTEKDVNLLVKEGIIVNCIGGSDKEISQLFNDICKNITVIGTCFGSIAGDLEKHCGRRRNKWMALLRHNYFHTPWALISFLAATFLILLTFLQTIFSGISTYK